MIKYKFNPLHFLILFSILGLIISGYSLYLKNTDHEKSFCNINEVFNCDIVNKGPYSKIFNIPIALLGVLGYLALILVSTFEIKKFFEDSAKYLLLLLTACAFGFSLYLTYLEAFVIRAWCILCISSAVLATLTFVFATIYFKKE